jgi:hypothetical protein
MPITLNQSGVEDMLITEINNKGCQVL